MKIKPAVLGIGCAACLCAAPITLIGVGAVSSSALDKSGLSGVYSDGTTTIPQAQLGAFGSGIAYTGFGNLFVAVNDRGFGNGLAVPPYADRFQLLNITVDPNSNSVATNLLDTRLFRNQSGQVLTGDSASFNTANPAATLRLDPESVRIGRDGSLFVSDEYGPVIYHFDQSGKLINSVTIPSKFGIANPNADGALELSGNTAGRQSNRGMEGLAITPDGRYLYGLMQNALIQDGGLNGNLSRVGLNNRLLRVDLLTGQTQEFIYQLDAANLGTNEILAINDHQFLVIERDGNSGSAARIKKIFKIDIAGATDVSSNNALPTTGFPAGVTAVSKSLLLDLLSPAFNLNAANDFPEKVEGLAWAPDLANGQHVLLVTSDNDLLPNNPTRIYAFGIDDVALGASFQKQQIDTPFATSVTEPSTTLLIGGGVLALVFMRVRIKARS